MRVWRKTARQDPEGLPQDQPGRLPGLRPIPHDPACSGTVVKNHQIAIFGATVVVLLNIVRLVSGAANLAVIPFRDGIDPEKMKKPIRRVVEPAITIGLVVLAFTFIPWLSSGGSAKGSIADRVTLGGRDAQGRDEGRGEGRPRRRPRPSNVEKLRRASSGEAQGTPACQRGRHGQVRFEARNSSSGDDGFVCNVSSGPRHDPISSTRRALRSASMSTFTTEEYPPAPDVIDLEPTMASGPGLAAARRGSSKTYMPGPAVGMVEGSLRRASRVRRTRRRAGAGCWRRRWSWPGRTGCWLDLESLPATNPGTLTEEGSRYSLRMGLIALRSSSRRRSRACWPAMRRSPESSSGWSSRAVPGDHADPDGRSTPSCST